MYRALLAVTLTFSSCIAFCQDEFNWTKFLKNGSPDSAISIYTRLTVEEDFGAKIPPSLSNDRLLNGRIVIDNALSIINPKIGSKDIPDFMLAYLDLSNLHFKRPVRIQFARNPVLIYNCIFENGVEIMLGDDFSGVEKKSTQPVYLAIENSELHGQISISVTNYDHVSFNSSLLEGNLDKYQYIVNTGTANTKPGFILPVFDTLQINGEPMKFEDVALRIALDDVKKSSFWNSTFRVPPRHTIAISTRSNIARFNNNRFEGDAMISGSVHEEFALRDNSFHGFVVLSELSFPQRNQIEWNDIKDRFAFRTKSMVRITGIPASEYQGFETLNTPTYTDSLELDYLYKGVRTRELVDKRNFDGLVEVYKTLFDNYKQKGNLQASNGCFVAAKELEGRRLAAIYHTEGGFKNFFSWKLNQLMKFYTNHATEPALALVISIYILLGFSVIYFFFPSEWDAESKGKLLRHYRDFVQKNDKGYVVPFLRMIGGFALSFVNAFTLSLNAFVTLGFGNIPTKGIARYICVVQGFVGWFLLSIFTVALFNQVLF